MKLLPMSFGGCGYEREYNLPPTKKDGARKCVLIRNTTTYKAGMEGVVIPLSSTSMSFMFQSNRYFFEKSYGWNKGLSVARMNNVYDFFPLVVREGKKEISHWHEHISLFDFRYITE